MRCPGNTIADANATTGHETLSRIIPQFRDLKMKLTLHATIIELVDGGTLKETFKSRNAKWHKSCYGKFTITNLRQAEKRKRYHTFHGQINADVQQDQPGVPRKMTRQSCDASPDREAPLGKRKSVF